MLKTEFQYFLDNQEKLVNLYKGKYIVIVGQKVVGSYNTMEEAYFESQNDYKLGEFLIQLCESGEEVYTQTFHSRVTFG